MTSIKEIVQSIFDSTKERVKNPIIGAFIFSWLAINWRIVLVLLFSEMKTIEKIQFIEENYFDIQLNLWFPLSFAVFYVLILPYLMALFDWLSQKGVSTRRLIAKNHRISEIQGRQEIAAEEWQLEKIRQGSPDITGLKNKVTELENRLREKDELINTLNEQLDPELTGKEDESEQSDGKENKSKRKITRRESTSKSKENKKEDTPIIKEEYPKVNQDKRSYPVMKDIVIRDLAKTEREWILIYALYSSDFGSKTLTREDLLSKYEESNRRTSSRIANLSNNLRSLIKAGQLKYINDDEMLLTEEGQEIAKEILNR